MSKFACTCGHTIRDQTDFLPYKAHIREDEDTQKPIELLAETLAQFWEARQQGQETDFVRQFERSELRSKRFPETLVESLAEGEVQRLAGKPLSTLLFNFIFPFWSKYNRAIYECEQCGRLWVEMDDGGLVPYLPETNTRYVLWSRHNHNPYGDLDE